MGTLKPLHHVKVMVRGEEELVSGVMSATVNALTVGSLYQVYFLVLL